MNHADSNSPAVTIPQSKLGERLAEAEAIKRDMTAMLQELETKVAGRPIAKPGSWRHHPLDWPPTR
jgi:hypothetical protein